ncbi:MAG: hypothetical protein PGN24_06485 [Microbacterium arborescens]
MSDTTPHQRDADDAHADDGAPTEAITDEVKADAAQADAGLTGGDGESDTEAPDHS